MGFIQLDLKSLDELDDGRVGIAFMHELKRAVLDCIDRPGDKGKRKVAIVFELVPTVGGEGGILECDGAEGTFKIKSTVPERKSKEYVFRLNKQGQLAYSSNSPENPDQTTFDDIDPKTGKVNREA